MSRRAWLGASLLAFLFLLAILASWIAPFSPSAIDAKTLLAGPSWSHIFGCDDLGRDVFSRVLYAYRVSLAVSLGSVAFALLAATPIGLLAGYFRGWTETLLMRPIDMMLAFPALLLGLILIAIVGPGSSVVLLAIAFIFTPILARVMRAAALVVSSQPYIDAAISRGARHSVVLVRHVLPNAFGPVLVQATVLAGFAIQIEAALSFLGLGAQPPTPSLGLMLSDGRDYLTIAPWLEIFPGLAIALTVAAFIMVGDTLRDRLDPRGLAG